MTGIQGWVRHPWYLGTLVLIWSWWWELRLSFLVVNCVLTVYVIVGTLLEEKKLVLTYGDAYKAYQKSVPMLIPFRRPPKKNRP